MTHTFQAHSSAPNFIFRCGINGCVQTFRRFSAISSHIKRKHHSHNLNSTSCDSGLSSATHYNDNCEEDMSQELEVSAQIHPNFEEEQPPKEPDYFAIQRACAAMILTLKEKHRLTQTALDFFIGQVRELINCVSGDLRLKVELVIQQHYITSGLELPDLSCCFEDVNPFKGLESEHMQSKFYREHFDLIVSRRLSDL